jgi:hypothetical protein
MFTAQSAQTPFSTLHWDNLEASTNKDFAMPYRDIVVFTPFLYNQYSTNISWLDCRTIEIGGVNDENMSLVQWFVFSFAVSFQYKYIFSVENIGNLLVSLNTR